MDGKQTVAKVRERDILFPKDAIRSTKDDHSVSVNQNEAPQSETVSSSSWKNWKKNQVIPAVALCFLGFAGFLCERGIGVTLLDLQIQTNASIEQVSWTLSARSIGSIVGALILGRFIDRPSRWIQITIFAFVFGVAFACAAWFSSFAAMIAAFTMYGFSASYSLTGGLLTTYALWETKKDSMTWQATTQVMYSMAGVISPFILEPFLAKVPETETSLNGTTFHNGTSSPAMPSDTRVMYGYLIIGVIVTVAGLIMVALHFIFDGIYVHGQQNNVKAPQPSTPAELVPLKIIISIILVLYFVAHSIYFRTFSNFILTFTVNHLGWTKSQGASLTAAFQGAGTGMRVLMILIVRIFSPQTILYSGLALCNISAIGLCLFVEHYDWAVWLFMCMLSAASVIPHGAILAWIDENVGLKGFVSVLFNFSLSIGETINSPLIGFFFEKVSYMAFIYYTMSGTAGCLLMMILLSVLGRVYKRKQQQMYDPL